jgi:hypothetical protein
LTAFSPAGAAVFSLLLARWPREQSSSRSESDIYIPLFRTYCFALFTVPQRVFRTSIKRSALL